MKAEIISIGTELTSGRNLDTNSQWLSRRLGGIGIPVHWHSTLADDLDENVQAFRCAAGRAQLVIITGGLGPTQDDLTRDALAKVAGVELVFHEPSFAFIQQLFASRKRPMPERNRVQALFPAGSEPIRNERGTAPGIWMELPSPLSPLRGEGPGERGSAAQPPHPNPLPRSGGEGEEKALIVALPGVPGEMFAMFDKEVQPRLQRLFPTLGIVVEHKINCFGAGESALEEKLLDLTRRGHEPEVGITVSDATISLRILAHAADVTAAEAIIAPVEQTIRERLGDLVFGTGDEDLQHAVAKLLMEKSLTIATAESITGGLIASRLTEVPGISAHLMGGVVAYDNRIKRDLLGVPQELLDQHGAVSPQVAEAMAAGCRARFGVDVAISTTGIAGPGGATPTKPVGLVYVGLATAKGVHSYKYNWFGTRQEVQSRTAKMALNIVRLALQKQ